MLRFLWVRLFRGLRFAGILVLGLRVLCGFDLFQADGLGWLDGCVLVLIWCLVARLFVPGLFEFWAPIGGCFGCDLSLLICVVGLGGLV